MTEPATISKTPSVLATTLGAIKTRLMSRPVPTADRASDDLGSRIDQLREHHGAIAKDLEEIDRLLDALHELRKNRHAELDETASTLNTLSQARTDLQRV